jgi:small-conductance mechanosensitive channel
VFGLFGDGDVDLKTILLVSIPTMVASAATWWLSQRKQWRQQTRAEKQEDIDQAIKRYEELLKRVDKDREEAVSSERKSQEVVANLRDQIRRIEIKAERAIAWIRHLEVTLDKHQIPYPVFHELGDTGRHNPLTPTTSDKGDHK